MGRSLFARKRSVTTLRPDIFPNVGSDLFDALKKESERERARETDPYIKREGDREERERERE